MHPCGGHTVISITRLTRWPSEVPADRARGPRFTPCSVQGAGSRPPPSLPPHLQLPIAKSGLHLGDVVCLKKKKCLKAMRSASIGSSKWLFSNGAYVSYLKLRTHSPPPDMIWKMVVGPEPTHSSLVCCPPCSRKVRTNMELSLQMDVLEEETPCSSTEGQKISVIITLCIEHGVCDRLPPGRFMRVILCVIHWS